MATTYTLAAQKTVNNTATLQDTDITFGVTSGKWYYFQCYGQAKCNGANWSHPKIGVNLSNGATVDGACSQIMQVGSTGGSKTNVALATGAGFGVTGNNGATVRGVFEGRFYATATGDATLGFAQVAAQPVDTILESCVLVVTEI